MNKEVYKFTLLLHDQLVGKSSYQISALYLEHSGHYCIFQPIAGYKMYPAFTMHGTVKISVHFQKRVNNLKPSAAPAATVFPQPPQAE
jgi:hypothetical protein